MRDMVRKRVLVCDRIGTYALKEIGLLPCLCRAANHGIREIPHDWEKHGHGKSYASVMGCSKLQIEKMYGAHTDANTKRYY